MALSGNIERIAQQLITPKLSLHPEFFNEDETMREEVQRKLLERANFIISRSLKKFPGLEVKDICLTGSMASYYYHKNSDIDMAIMFENNGCPYLTDDKLQLLRLFLNLGRGGNFPYKLLKFNGREIDTALQTRPILKFVGVYSILENKWIRKITPEFTQGITPQDIIQKSYALLAELAAYLKERHIDGESYPGNEKDAIRHQVHYFLNYKRDESLLDYLGIKLLKSHDRLSKITQPALLSL